MTSPAGTTGTSDPGADALACSVLPSQPWVFGKIPAHGDFVGRGLPPGLRDALDNWLSHELARARTRFADFDERYRLAPPWHFVDCDPTGRWSGGALCLSVDAVGRRFPVLLAGPAAGPGEAQALALAALELAFDALGGGWDVGRLHEALCTAAPPAWTGVVPLWPGWAIDAEDGTRVEEAGRFPDGLIERMLELVR